MLAEHAPIRHPAKRRRIKTVIQELMYLAGRLPSTGYSNLVDETQAKARGIKGFAMKSLTRKALACLLRDVLEGPKPLTPAPPPSIAGDAI